MRAPPPVVVCCCCCASGRLPVCWTAARRVVRPPARATGARLRGPCGFLGECTARSLARSRAPAPYIPPPHTRTTCVLCSRLPCDGFCLICRPRCVVVGRVHVARMRVLCRAFLWLWGGASWGRMCCDDCGTSDTREWSRGHVALLCGGMQIFVKTLTVAWARRAGVGVHAWGGADTPTPP